MKRLLFSIQYLKSMDIQYLKSMDGKTIIVIASVSTRLIVSVLSIYTPILPATIFLVMEFASAR